MINVAQVKKYIHAKGWRVTPSFLYLLNDTILAKLDRACLVHNGGSKTLDVDVAAYVGLTGRAR